MVGMLQTHLPPGVEPKPKGLLVYLDYDQDEIDAAYDQAPWSPNEAAITRRNAQRCAAALARLGPPRRIAYGRTPVEQVEIYSPAAVAPAPVVVFIHGGAWRRGRLFDLGHGKDIQLSPLPERDGVL